MPLLYREFHPEHILGVMQPAKTRVLSEGKKKQFSFLVIISFTLMIWMFDDVP